MIIIFSLILIVVILDHEIFLDNILKVLIDEYIKVRITIYITSVYFVSLMIVNTCYQDYGFEGLIVGYVPAIIFENIFYK